MPLLKIKNESYRGDETLEHVVNYALRSGLTGGLAVDPDYAVEQMLLVKQLWYKSDPERRQARHFIVSFADNEQISLEEAMQYGYEICRYYSDRFQIVFGFHEDTDHEHLHFAMNTVSYVDGKMYSGGLPDYLGLRDHIRSLRPEWEVKLVRDQKLEKE